MNKKLWAAILLSVAAFELASAQDSSPAQPAPNPQPSSTQPSATTERDISIDNEHRILLVVEGAQRLTTKWAFVVDNSHSTWDIGGRILKGFQAATEYPTDQLRFCAYVFHDEGVHKFRDWVWASQQEFETTERWISRNHGVCSYGARAIAEALRQPVAELSVVIISDGGFTESAAVIKRTVAEAQEWRRTQGYNPAIICAVGIENMLGPNTRPRPYPKPSNEDCQQLMRDIGTEGGGGYIYVQPANSRNTHGTHPSTPTARTATPRRRVG